MHLIGGRVRAMLWDLMQIGHHADRFGNVAQVFSTYEARRTAPGGPVSHRGINSVQLLRHQDRWWITSVVFDTTRGEANSGGVRELAGRPSPFPARPPEEPVNGALAGTVAVVTGASRGAGRAIAHVLGERGATLYVTGRSVRGGRPTPDGMPGTIDDTAAEVTERGGAGIAVRCDHTMDAEVEALFEHVRAEQDGRLDLLVNNACGGYEGRMAGLPQDPFWKQDPGFWDSMFTVGVRPALTASRLAAPRMVERGRGLIVNVVAWMGGAYLRHLWYDLARSAAVRMAFGMAHELRPHGVAAVALAPGFMRTER